MGLVLLLRHGETDMTQGRYCGSSDPPLNARGREQAARIANLLRRKSLAAIYSSPLLRALQTAEPTAHALGLQVRVIDALREINFGRWEGLTFADARRRYPAEWQQRQADPYAVAPPDGENYRDLVARVLPAFEELFARHPNDDFAVFGHKSVNRVLVACILEMPIAYYRRIELAPGALTVLRLRNGRRELLALNDCCHLGARPGQWPRGSAAAP